MRMTYHSAFKSAGTGHSPLWKSITLSQRFWASYTSVFEKRRYRPPMAALCKAPTKSAGIGLSIMAVCKNAGTGRFFCSDIHTQKLCI